MATETSSKQGQKFFVEIDEVVHEWREDTISGAQLMTLGNIPPEAGLVLLHDDGTQEAISPDRVIDLKPGLRVKKRPRFKRG